MTQPYVSYAAVAGQRDFDVPFPYINRSHVQVRVNGAPAGILSWPTATRLRLAQTATAGAAVEIERVTPIDEQLVQFQDGNILTAEDLNVAVQQQLYRLQEVSGLYERTLQQAQVRVGENLGIVTNPEDVAQELAELVLENQVLDNFRARIADIDMNANSILAQSIEVDAISSRVDSAEGAIVVEQQTRATETSALAQSISAISSTLNGNTATIATLAQSVNGLSARYGVSLDVNGYVTGFVQNNDGQTGSFLIRADRFAVVTPGESPIVPFEVTGSGVRIRGNLVVNGSIDSAQLAPNSVTQGNSAYTAGSVAISNTGWTTVQSCTLTTTGGRVRVDFCGAFEAFGPGNGEVSYRVRRGATVIRTGTLVRIFGEQSVEIKDANNPSVTLGDALIPYPTAGTYSIFVVDDDPAAAAHTYHIDITSMQPGGTMSSRQMGLLELKR